MFHQTVIVKMDIMKILIKNVLNVLSNVPNVLMKIHALSVLKVLVEVVLNLHADVNLDILIMEVLQQIVFNAFTLVSHVLIYKHAILVFLDSL